MIFKGGAILLMPMTEYDNGSRWVLWIEGKIHGRWKSKNSCKDIVLTGHQHRHLVNSDNVKNLDGKLKYYNLQLIRLSTKQYLVQLIRLWCIHWGRDYDRKGYLWRIRLWVQFWIHWIWTSYVVAKKKKTILSSRQLAIEIRKLGE